MSENFNENLKNARIAMKYTQKDVASAIGVAKSTYSLYESGGREPNVLTIKKISNVLNISADDLLGIPDAAQNAPRVLRPDESHLLTDYNKLNDTGKGKVREYASDLTEQEKYTVDKKENAGLSEAG